MVSVFTGAERASTAKEAAEKDMYCKRAVGVEPTTVDGEAAWRCIYTVQDVRGTNLYVLHGDAEYQVIYSSRLEGFNKFEPDYEAVMKSWKWSQ